MMNNSSNRDQEEDDANNEQSGFYEFTLKNLIKMKNQYEFLKDKCELTD